MTDESNPHQQSLPKFDPAPILPRMTKSEIVQTSSLQEITLKMITETSALVSFLSVIVERIQIHLSLTKESLNHLFQCLDFIPRTNFFYPLSALKQITDMLGQLMKAVEQSIIDSSIKKAIFEKGYRINDALIDYRLKEKYLAAFFSSDCNANLSETFYSDIKKLSKRNKCNIGAVNQLQLIFDSVSCKMSWKYRNDIGNQLYELRILARTNFRKFSYQPDINKKQQLKMAKASGQKGMATSSTISNANSIANIEGKGNYIADDIEIIQLFAQEELKKTEKGSFSTKHVYNSNQGGIKDNETSYNKPYSLQPNVIEGHKEISCFNEEKVCLSNQQGFNDNDGNSQEIINQIQLPKQQLINNAHEEIEAHEEEMINTIPIIKEFNPFIAEPLINNTASQSKQISTEPNIEQDKLSPTKPPLVVSSQRAQSQEQTHSTSSTISAFPSTGIITNTNQGSFKSNEPNSGSYQKATGKMKHTHNDQKSKNAYNQGQNQNQNYVNMQMANFYQNLMTMNSQSQLQPQSRFFPQANHQFNNSNNVHITTITAEQLKADYASLKSLSIDNPALVKSNLLKYEQFIILPIYLQLNRLIAQKWHVYSDIFNKYKPIITSVLTKNELDTSIVQPFGSIVNNFLLDEGDVDICIVPSNCTIENFSVHLNEICEAITSKRIGTCLLSHISPRYSLLKISDSETGMTVDITVQSMLPLYNTKLIRAYSLYDQRFHIIGMYVKYWAKRNKINGATEKYLSSYALIIMIIHFLQMETKPSVLPVLQRVSSDNKPYDYSHSERGLISNVYYEEDAVRIKQYMSIVNCGQENKESVACLLLKFFEFYAYSYDHSYLLSISNSEKNAAASNEHIAFPIEDPFDEEHNPGKSMKLNSSQYDTFILCMKKEINQMMRGEIFTNDFLLGY